MASYKNGTVKSVTTPLGGGPTVVKVECDNLDEPPVPTRKIYTFEILHEKTIDRLIGLIKDPNGRQVDIETDTFGTISHVSYH